MFCDRAKILRRLKRLKLISRLTFIYNEPLTYAIYIFRGNKFSDSWPLPVYSIKLNCPRILGQHFVFLIIIIIIIIMEG